MEVVSDRKTSRMNGAVVRQFAPTRIEREILAQIFALVWGQCNQISTPREGHVLEWSLREVDQRAEPFGGRRVS